VIIKSLISRAILKYVPFYCIKCMIFDQLIFRKIINFVATRCRILRLKFTKFNFAGRAYSAPPDPLAGGKGARCPLTKNLTPALGPSGLALRPFRPQYSALRALKFGPSSLNLPPQILKASAVPANIIYRITRHIGLFSVLCVPKRQDEF